jgi:hypothetical protein
MFDRQYVLRRIQTYPTFLIGYSTMVEDFNLTVKRVDEVNEIYLISIVDWSDHYGPVCIFEIEEMTSEQAVDRFQELLCQVAISNALFGWINGNG